MNLIETLSLAGLTTVTSATLPSSYRHLRVVGVLRSTRSGQASSSMDIRLNGDAGSNYGYQIMFGNGSSVGGSYQSPLDRFARLTIPAATAPTGACEVLDLIIPAYRSGFNKQGLLLNGERTSTASTGMAINAWTNEWRNTAAISSLTLLDVNGAAWATGSFVDIYGIA